MPLDEGMSNVTVGAQGYRFEPHGLQFLKPVRITMAFDPSIVDSPTALSNLYTYFFDSIAGRWERLERETVDTERRKDHQSQPPFHRHDQRHFEAP